MKDIVTRYIYACSARTMDEMADMMHEFRGREMTAQIWVNGDVKLHRIVLDTVDSWEASFFFEGDRYTMPLDDVFGQGVTRVHAKKDEEVV